MPTRYSLILLLIATLAAACGDEGSSGSPASNTIASNTTASNTTADTGVTDTGAAADASDDIREATDATADAQGEDTDAPGDAASEDTSVSDVEAPDAEEDTRASDTETPEDTEPTDTDAADAPEDTSAPEDTALADTHEDDTSEPDAPEDTGEVDTGGPVNGVWGDGARLDDVARDQDDLHPKVGVDADSNAIAAWWDTPEHNVWASRYDRGADTWSAAEALEPEPGDGASWVELAVAPSGDAAAIWLREYDDAAMFDVRARHFDGDTRTWGAVETVDVIVSPVAGLMDITSDASGNFMAVFTVRDAEGSSQLHAVRYDAAASAWSEPVTVRDDFASSPVICGASDGRAVAAWDEVLPEGVWVAHYDPDAGWGDPIQLHDVEADSRVACAISDSGAAFVVFQEDNSLSDGTVMAFRYDGATWDDGQRFGDSGNLTATAAAANANGDAFIVWEEPVTGGDLGFARYDAASGWSEPGAIAYNGDGASVVYPRIVLAPNGEATLAWGDDGDTVVARWSTVLDVWLTPTALEEASSFAPGLALDVAPNSEVLMVRTSAVILETDRVLAQWFR